jgi:hypothetical protein
MKRCLLWILLSFAVFGVGCRHRTKVESNHIAADTEEAFKQRWIAKRMSELQAAGVTDGREARRQATEEFRKKYEFINASKSPNPVGGENK